jgi:hypothetical protein
VRAASAPRIREAAVVASGELASRPALSRRLRQNVLTTKTQHGHSTFEQKSR